MAWLTALPLTFFNQYKEDSLDIIQENPYQLVEDIQGIGFKSLTNSLNN